MMTIEEFLAGKKPKGTPHASCDLINGLLPDNWKDWYFDKLEETMCSYRDKKIDKIAISNIATYLNDENQSIRCHLTIEQLAFVAGYLRTRGFNAKEYFSIIEDNNPYYCACVEINW